MARAQSGDQQAFAELIEPYRRELQVHCYRMLGSAHDAEDALQEALLSAWRGLGAFEGDASFRRWMYRVATNRCLDALRAVKRRSHVQATPLDVEPPEPTRHGEVLWLVPYPDALLGALVDEAPGPEAQHDAREAISLAFVTALQLLPPRQRAVLLLRDVLGYRAREVAAILDATEESVTSALKRARQTLRTELADADAGEPPPAAHSSAEQEVVDRLARAYEAGDLDGRPPDRRRPSTTQSSTDRSRDH
jgi:RNA polymerase sigma-70 factor (ECF subfamily)